MGLFDSVLGALAGEPHTANGTTAASSPLMGMISGLLTQSGGLQGLAQQFAQSGHGDAFSSWVGTGQNQPISGDQIQRVLGSAQVQQLAARFDLDPMQVSHFLAECLPKVVDGLTPKGNPIQLIPM